MIIKNKKIFIVGSIVVVIIIVGIVVILSLGKRKPPLEKTKEEVLPATQLLLTVDASVEVTISSANKKEVLLTVDHIPQNTTSIDYDLSYLTQDDIPRGVIGTIPISGKDQLERKITLGTCSSGRCVYDQGVAKIKVSLTFNGDYGSRLFEKEFEI